MRNKLRELAPMMVVLEALGERLQEVRKNSDRGDVSISTVIIWVAVIGVAVGIATIIGVTLYNKYSQQLTGL
ncbi:hypothetical protein J7F01_08830 [Streptomyces sp. ISL-22]|uniref:hypothetical protein n=1 Tax=unclassified Streptomyces TaxID=2593676 RepID=UPI001BE8FDDE|nr:MULTISPECIES: hypothetical protein [unclassified Streptomyces]MBT2418019.1 hypothetical protein [Streptomyces sp. ISL-24]MBT2432306.1 hypothetical protein [Streptomyces sp. ISL-22]